MINKSLHAWVIHKQWTGDTSARVNFFTRELGLVNCLCKGGRTPKKQSLLQAFTPLWLAVDERHDRFYARSIESTAPMLALQGDALFSALYVNELLQYILNPLYPLPDLFDAYILTLTSLEQTNDRMEIESLLRRFEWALLKSSGATFSLRHEAQGDRPISASNCYQFIPGEGFICSSNHKGIPGEHILALADDHLNEAGYLKSAKIIMRQAIDFLLGGREVKSRSLYL